MTPTHPVARCHNCNLDIPHRELLDHILITHNGDYTYPPDQDLRREIVLREINEGALAGMPSRITQWAAQHVLDALSRYDAWAATNTPSDTPSDSAASVCTERNACRDATHYEQHPGTLRWQHKP